MTTKSEVPQLVDDPTEALSSFVETEVIEGTIVNIDIVKSKTKLTDGRNKGKLPTFLLFEFENITELRMADGSTPDADTWSHRYPYSFWDEENGRTLAPFKDNSRWWDAVVPAFAEAGVKIGGADNNLGDCLQKVARFEMREFTLGYQRAVRNEETGDPDNGFIVWVTEPSAPGAKDGEPEMEDATWEAAVPINIEGLKFDAQEAYDVAAKLRAENEDDAAFKKAAIADPTIKKVTKLRRIIQSDKYDAEEHRNA